MWRIFYFDQSPQVYFKASVVFMCIYTNITNTVFVAQINTDGLHFVLDPKATHAEPKLLLLCFYFHIYSSTNLETTTFDENC